MAGLVLSTSCKIENVFILFSFDILFIIDP